MTYVFIFFIFLITLIPLHVYLEIRREAKDFNKGVCLGCGAKLYRMWTGREGTRLYACYTKHCDHTAWVTYDTVDDGYIDEFEEMWEEME